MMSGESGLETALWRFGVVSAIIGQTLTGTTLSAAVAEAAKTAHVRGDKRLRQVGKRSIYRWVSAYRQRGFDGLFDRPRPKTADSAVLSKDLVEYLTNEKAKDPRASIPEIIRRAAVDGKIAGEASVNRVTVYRCAKRLNLPVFRRRELGRSDMRRHARRHRLRLVLSDGKHFRAGMARRRRVAMIFLDDAHRFGLYGVVGTSENKQVFLRGLFETLLRFGKMGALYLDHGAAFVAHDVALICARLGIGLIHGAKGYPEGHGKIERFHDTLMNDLLRGLDKNPDVDPDPKALELRLNHYLAEIYNRRHHGGIKGVPEQRFLADEVPLEHVPEAILRSHFVIHERRRVSKDNVVMVDGVAYEMPLGHAGTMVVVRRHLLEGQASVMHEGKPVMLAPVDVFANAQTPRGRRGVEREVESLPPTTAAMKYFAKTFPPLVGSDGGLLRRPPTNEEHE